MNIFITGAGSAIAQAVARLYAAQGASFFLVDRNEALLKTVTADLSVRGAQHVEAVTANMTDYAQHPDMLKRADQVLGGVDVLLIAHGTLPNQDECEQSWQKTQDALAINSLSALSLLTHVAHYFEKRAGGTIAVISSVAGDRGRQSNYVYGAAKGALTVFTEGLRNRLDRHGVHVLTIKPGFVDTPMTAAFEKGVLWVKPEVVARDIVRAIEKGKDVLYTPRRWRLIMAVIKLIPERVFKRMNL